MRDDQAAPVDLPFQKQVIVVGFAFIVIASKPRTPPIGDAELKRLIFSPTACSLAGITFTGSFVAFAITSVFRVFIDRDASWPAMVFLATAFVLIGQRV